MIRMAGRRYLLLMDCMLKLFVFTGRRRWILASLPPIPTPVILIVFVLNSLPSFEFQLLTAVVVRNDRLQESTSFPLSQMSEEKQNTALYIYKKPNPKCFLKILYFCLLLYLYVTQRRESNFILHKSAT